MRRTFADAKASRIPIALNISSSDARFAQWVNAAQQRLMPRGHWHGCTPRYSVNVTDQLFTLPPQIATIEKVAIAKAPVILRNEWYEWMDQGLGTYDDPTSAIPDSGVSQALFRSMAPTNKDMSGSYRLRLQCDLAADVGAQVLVLGYDSSGNWIRTLQAAVWADGELVTLAQSPGTLTTTTFSRITDIQKPATKGQVYLYEYTGSANNLLCTYQYFETRPSYRRYLLPVIPGATTQIDLIGKAAFIPVVNDTDYLIIPNLEALRLAAMSVKAEEERDFGVASMLMNGKRDPVSGRAIVEGAITILEDELSHFSGSGAVPTMTVIYGAPADPVEALI